MTTIILPNNWKLRPHQRRAWIAWEKGIRNELLIWHRRAGKDAYCLNKTAVAAHERIGNYWHGLPQYAQARKAIWEAVNPATGKKRVEEAFPLELRKNTRNDEMTIEFKIGSTWRIVGLDNPDSLVGSSPVGMVFSEWALANPMVLPFISPIINENRGWMSFITTPRGRNHAASMYDRVRSDANWFTDIVPNSQTGLIDNAMIEADRLLYADMFGREMADVLIDQEYECSFAGAMIGSYYGPLMQRAESEGRIRDFSIDRKYPVHTAWDLGKAANNPIWCFQVINQTPFIVDILRPESDEIEDWVQWLTERAYHGIDYVPHDIMRAEWGSRRTRFERLKELGRRPKRVVSVSIEEGRTAARQTINKAVFHKTNCLLGIDAMWQYRREYDEELKRFRETPVKDWADHIADGFRYLALSWRDVPLMAPPVVKPKELIFEARKDGSVVGNMNVRDAIEAMRRRKARD